MKHIKTPVRSAALPHGNGIALRDAEHIAIIVDSLEGCDKGTMDDVALAVNYHDRMADICQRIVTAEQIANEHEDFTMLVNVTEDARALLAEMEATCQDG